MGHLVQRFGKAIPASASSPSCSGWGFLVRRGGISRGVSPGIARAGGRNSSLAERPRFLVRRSGGLGWLGVGGLSGGSGGGRPVRVFISYAHDDPGHEGLVRELWVFLRACGVDARLDLAAAQDRVDWAAWMTREVRDADRVLVIASPAYKRRAEGDAGPDEGRGVQWEARLIRDLFYADQEAGMRRFVPVVLPGGSAEDIPLWLAPASAAHYRVSEFTVAGAERCCGC